MINLEEEIQKINKEYVQKCNELQQLKKKLEDPITQQDYQKRMLQQLLGDSLIVKELKTNQNLQRVSNKSLLKSVEICYREPSREEVEKSISEIEKQIDILKNKKNLLLSPNLRLL